MPRRRGLEGSERALAERKRAQRGRHTKRKAPRGRIRGGLGFRSDSAVGRPLHQQVTRFRLESVRQTREDFSNLLFDCVIFAFGGVNLGLVVAGAEVDGRALAQAVFVLRGETDVVEIGVFVNIGNFSRTVDIVGADRQVAVADRNDRAEVEAVALGAFVKEILSDSLEGSILAIILDFDVVE